MKGFFNWAFLLGNSQIWSVSRVILLQFHFISEAARIQNDFFRIRIRIRILLKVSDRTGSGEITLVNVTFLSDNQYIEYKHRIAHNYGGLSLNRLLLMLTYDGAYSRVRNEEVGILAGNLGRRRASRAGEWTRLVGPVGLARPQPHRRHHGGRVQPGEHHRLRGHRLQVHLVGGSQLARHLNRRKTWTKKEKKVGSRNQSSRSQRPFPRL